MFGSPLTRVRCSLHREQATGGAEALAALPQLANFKIGNDNSIVADGAKALAALTQLASLKIGNDNSIVADESGRTSFAAFLVRPNSGCSYLFCCICLPVSWLV